jgi:hypothetical protein
LRSSTSLVLLEQLSRININHQSLTIETTIQVRTIGCITSVPVATTFRSWGLCPDDVRVPLLLWSISSLLALPPRATALHAVGISHQQGQRSRTVRPVGRGRASILTFSFPQSRVAAFLSRLRVSEATLGGIHLPGDSWTHYCASLPSALQRNRSLRSCHLTVPQPDSRRSDAGVAFAQGSCSIASRLACLPMRLERYPRAQVRHLDPACS